MIFPLSFLELSLWLGVTSFVILVTTELIASLYDYSPRLLINRTVLRAIGVACGIAFLATIVWRIIPFL